MKQHFLLISLLFSFAGIIHAQQPYRKAQIQVMPDGTRKAVLVQGQPTQPVYTGSLLNIKVQTEKDGEEVQTESLGFSQGSVKIESSRPFDLNVQKQISTPPPFSEQSAPPAKNDYVYFQPYAIADESDPMYKPEYPDQDYFSIAVHYELIPASGFSDLAHNAGVQVTIDHLVIDGFIGRGSVSYEYGSVDMSESYTSYGAGLGYKMRVAPRFHIYPLVGMVKCETISDKLTYNYGIGLHYFFNKRFFLSYKFTRYTNGLGIGISLE